MASYLLTRSHQVPRVPPTTADCKTADMPAPNHAIFVDSAFKFVVGAGLGAGLLWKVSSMLGGTHHDIEKLGNGAQAPAQAQEAERCAFPTHPNCSLTTAHCIVGMLTRHWFGPLSLSIDGRLFRRHSTHANIKTMNGAQHPEAVALKNVA